MVVGTKASTRKCDDGQRNVLGAKEQMKEKKDMEATRDNAKKQEFLTKLWGLAEAGDVDALGDLAVFYRDGTNGIEKNLGMAYTWFDRLRLTGSPWAMAEVGYALVEGKGVAKNVEKGVMYISTSAGRDCDYGAFLLGLALADGKYGLPVDRTDAVYWLMKALSGTCEHQNLDPHEIKEAEEKLDELFGWERK